MGLLQSLLGTGGYDSYCSLLGAAFRHICPDLFVRTTLDQLRIALAEHKRRVGWTVEELIDRLHQVGVEVAVEPTFGTSH